jgi:hypothetical protein
LTRTRYQQRLLSTSERFFVEPEARVLAEVSDFQGVGRKHLTVAAKYRVSES